jgi:hypothetical protein
MRKRDDKAFRLFMELVIGRGAAYDAMRESERIRRGFRISEGLMKSWAIRRARGGSGQQGR